MTNRQIAEELYRSFKSQVLWKEIDFKRILKFEKILTKRFDEKVKSGINNLLKENNIDATIDAVIIDENEPFVSENFTEVLDKLKELNTTEQTVNEFNEINNSEKPTPVNVDEVETPINNIYKKPEVIITDKHKRYLVEITYTTLMKPFNFQTLKIEDVIRRNHYGQILNKMTKVRGYVDTTENEEYIYDVIIREHCRDGIVRIKHVEDIKSIPEEFKTFWKNQTFL
jgi:hypothetical protein